jgi:integration host factor subunit alpha
VDLIDSLYSQLGLSKAKSTELIESLLETIKETLESGEDVLISGFAKFCVKEKKKRRGRNPQTGEDLMLDAGRLATFRCSGRLRDRINAKGRLLDGR